MDCHLGKNVTFLFSFILLNSMIYQISICILTIFLQDGTPANANVLAICRFMAGLIMEIIECLVRTNMGKMKI
jgi:hypothetical protein